MTAVTDGYMREVEKYLREANYLISLIKVGKNYYTDIRIGRRLMVVEQNMIVVVMVLREIVRCY
jgi:hypothetical protein